MILKNLFVIRSPLQLINAIEAQNFFNTSNNQLIIIHTKKNIKNKELIEAIVKHYNLEKTFSISIYHQDSGRSKLITMVRFIKELQKECYEYLFIADAGSLQIIIAANLDSESVIHLDDGTKTIEKQEEKLFIPQTYKNLKITRKIRYWRYWLFGLQAFIKKPIDLFTIFNIKALESQKIISNNYNYFNNLLFLEKKFDEENIYFIGQGLSEANIVSETFYLNLLKSLKKQFHNKKIIYLPHRGEKISKEKLELVDDLFKIYSPNLPVELEFLEQEKYPKKIVGIASTALFTLGTLFKNAEVCYFKIPDEEYLNIEKKDIWNKIYSYFENEKHLRKLTLNNKGSF